MSKSIKEYEEIFKRSSYIDTKEAKEQVLKFTLEKIKFLESIYITGKENNIYSK